VSSQNGPGGVPGVDCYLKRHDPERRMVVLQHHPPLEPFMKGWDQFLDILDRVTAGGGVLMLPGEYADLCRSGTLPLEPRALIPDPALECTMRMALDKWKKPLAKEDLAGIEKRTHLRDANLRGNAITDVKPLSDLWAAVNQEIDVAAQGSPCPTNSCANRPQTGGAGVAHPQLRCLRQRPVHPARRGAGKRRAQAGGLHQTQGVDDDAARPARPGLESRFLGRRPRHGRQGGSVFPPARLLRHYGALRPHIRKQAGKTRHKGARGTDPEERMNRLSASATLIAARTPGTGWESAALVVSERRFHLEKQRLGMKRPSCVSCPS
jgi:hypothetical protein